MSCPPHSIRQSSADLTTDYEYDLSGRLTAVILPVVVDATDGVSKRPRYEYEYDLYGNQVLIRDNVSQSLAGVVSYDHDGISGTDVRETAFAYDHLGRQVARTLPAGIGGTPEMRTFAGTFRETMSYDEAGRLERSTDFEGRTTDYVYDELGRLDEKRFYAPGTSLTDPADEIVDYAYGRVSEVLQDRDGSGGYTTGDLLTRHTYDPRYGRLTRVTTDQDGDAMTPDRVLNYAYDNATGRQLSTWTGNTSDSASASVSTRTDHTYDRLGRLATTDSVKLAGGAGAGTTTYRYDPVGNLEYVLGPAHASY